MIKTQRIFFFSKIALRKYLRAPLSFLKKNKNSSETPLIRRENIEQTLRETSFFSKKCRGFFLLFSRRQPVQAQPYYAVLGCHSSGSSALAGVLYHLGVHLGTRLVGFHGNAPIFGGEAFELAELFEESLPVPETTHRLSRDLLRQRLEAIFFQQRFEATQKRTVAAGKFPQLATCADLLHEILGDQLRVILCERPLENSIASLHKRFPHCTREEICQHQQYIHACLENLSTRLPADKILRISYSDLIHHPRETVDLLANFIRPRASLRQRIAAVHFIQPDLQHFGR